MNGFGPYEILTLSFKYLRKKAKCWFQLSLTIIIEGPEYFVCF